MAAALGLLTGGAANALPSISPSSSASSGPQAGTTGSVVLNFGGINLGNQDIPLSATSAASSNAAPTVGNTPTAVLSGLAGLSSGAYSPLILAAGIVALVWYLSKHK
jgi:hypothetical protein